MSMVGLHMLLYMPVNTGFW